MLKRNHEKLHLPMKAVIWLAASDLWWRTHSVHQQLMKLLVMEPKDDAVILQPARLLAALSTFLCSQPLLSDLRTHQNASLLRNDVTGVNLLPAQHGELLPVINSFFIRMRMLGSPCPENKHISGMSQESHQKSNCRLTDNAGACTRA